MAEIEFKEEYPWEKGFGVIFKKNIEGVLLNAEIMRRMIFLFFFLIVLSVFVLFLKIPALDEKGIEYHKISLECVVAFTAAFFITIRFYRFYGNRVKKKIMPFITGFFDKNIQYSGKGYDYVNPREIKLFYAFDDYESDDTFFAKSNDFPFSLSEISLVRFIKTDKETIRKKFFRGIALNIIAKGLPLIIVKERAALISDEVFAGHQRFHIEDPVFENIYDSYCDDQLEARKVFRPKVIEAILRFGILSQNIEKRTNSLENMVKDDYKSLRRDHAPRFFFNNRGVALIIPCKKDLFEPLKLFANSARTDEIKMVLYQLHLVTELIKTLKEQILTR